MADSGSKGLVVITGASSGIGEACARSFSGAGHPLLLLARRVERMEALGLPNALSRKVDVTDMAAVRAAVEEAEAKYGPVSCLVNNAGCMLLGSMDTQDTEEWTRMLNVNVMGVLNAMRVVIKGMKERRSGTIINMSSIAGRKTFPSHAVYCGTKYAVHGLTEGVRQEVSGSNVRCVTVAPAVVETDLATHTTDAEILEGFKQWKATLEKALEPDDVARTVLFAYQQPPHVCIREVVIAPTTQEP